MNIPLIFLVIIAFMSLINFILCYADKQKAKAKRWRISEATLLLTAFFGGAGGLWAGMYLFRHKTRHLKFTLLVPLFLAIHVAVFFIFIL